MPGFLQKWNAQLLTWNTWPGIGRWNHRGLVRMRGGITAQTSEWFFERAAPHSIAWSGWGGWGGVVVRAQNSKGQAKEWKFTIRKSKPVWRHRPLLQNFSHFLNTQIGLILPLGECRSWLTGSTVLFNVDIRDYGELLHHKRSWNKFISFAAVVGDRSRNDRNGTDVIACVGCADLFSCSLSHFLC